MSRSPRARWWLAALCLIAMPAHADSATKQPDTKQPEWAYPIAPAPVAVNANSLRMVRGSARSYTDAQIQSDFDPPDWHPDEHPPMPPAVGAGRRPLARACAACHLPNGAGHPETANLSAHPAADTLRQMRGFIDGTRGGPMAVAMAHIAQALQANELAESADYFASLRPIVTSRVVEAASVPRSAVGPGGMRLPLASDESEPIGTRIIALPADLQRVLNRDSRAGFISYVPPGSLERGRALANGEKSTGAGGCGSCHGADLRGGDGLAPIAGQHPLYLYRQMNDIRNGARTGAAAVMKPMLSELSDSDLIALAAYIGGLVP
jgi:cytochrome c553